MTYLKKKKEDCVVCLYESCSVSMVKLLCLLWNLSKRQSFAVHVTLSKAWAKIEFCSALKVELFFPGFSLCFCIQNDRTYDPSVCLCSGDVECTVP